MLSRMLLGMLCAAVVLGGGKRDVARAEYDWRKTAISEDWMHDFTVLTMAHDGAWGTATDTLVGRAIAQAIANCKAMAGTGLGCGAYLTTIRAGWSLGLRCGREIIVVAEKFLPDAERSALRRETTLRSQYMPDMPACERVVTVDPNGVVIAPVAAGYSRRQD